MQNRDLLIKDLVENLPKIIISVVFLLAAIIIFTKTSGRYAYEREVEKFENELKLHPKDSFYGTSFITHTYPIFKDVAFVGDSYSHVLAQSLGYDFTVYSCPGLKLELLKNTFESALESNKKIVVIFIGPNDYMANTKPKDFRKLLLSYVNDIRNVMKAKVIICSYLESYFTKLGEEEKKFDYTIKDYDDEILSIIDNEKEIYYFDIKDMNDEECLKKYSHFFEDNYDTLHFNKAFSIDFMNKLYSYLIDLKRKELDAKR